MDLEKWRTGVKEHIEVVDQTIKDRDLLKKAIEEHLSKVFEWESIKYNRDFSVISLYWAYGESPVIRSDKVSELGMDWLIKADYDDSANRVVVIEVYPWGIEEGYHEE